MQMRLSISFLRCSQLTPIDCHRLSLKLAYVLCVWLFPTKYPKQRFPRSILPEQVAAVTNVVSILSNMKVFYDVLKPSFVNRSLR